MTATTDTPLTPAEVADARRHRVSIRGAGMTPAILAADLRPGMVRLLQGGYRYRVTAVRHSQLYVLVTMEALAFDGDGRRVGHPVDVRLRPDLRVPILLPEDTDA